MPYYLKKITKIGYIYKKISVQTLNNRQCMTVISENGVQTSEPYT